MLPAQKKLFKKDFLQRTPKNSVIIDELKKIPISGEARESTDRR